MGTVINFNGVSYETTGSLSLKNGKIYVDGKELDSKNVFGSSVSSNTDISIIGNVESIQTTNGDITVNGNVTDITTTNGDVEAHTIYGNIKTTNGDIKTKYKKDITEIVTQPPKKETEQNIEFIKLKD